MISVRRAELPANKRVSTLKSWLDVPAHRLGHITSLDGKQLITLGLDTASGTAQIWETPLDQDQYTSLTPAIPQCHWFERAIWDMFGLYAYGHPRLKGVFLHEVYAPEFQPLRAPEKPASAVSQSHRKHDFLRVHGEGVYEIPVGPIHAGIIEPGHFRLSCLGEVIVNLELRLGYLHRGIEKRFTEIPWQNGRFLAEATASDTAAANALAHCEAVESILAIEPPEKAKYLRTLALEIERAAMHIADIGGIATDIGYIGIAASLSRLRGSALALGDILGGSRFLRSYILPGGVRRDITPKDAARAAAIARQLRHDSARVVKILLDNPIAGERLEHVGRVSHSLAKEFGLVGVAARASDIAYDARACFAHAAFPSKAPATITEKTGDALARTRVRALELDQSLQLMASILDDLPGGDTMASLPDHLPPSAVGLGVVESFRGELIHLFFTDNTSKVMRYTIKDPSFNNWTAVAIGVRNNLVADFPICNKSFSLSYSGHDL